MLLVKEILKGDGTLEANSTSGVGVKENTPTDVVIEAVTIELLNGTEPELGS